MAHVGGLADPGARAGGHGGHRRVRLRPGGGCVVAVLQPRVVGRPAGCARADGRRGRDHLPPRSSVDRERHDGLHADRLRHPGAVSRIGGGSGDHTGPAERTAPSYSGRSDRDRLRRLDPDPNERHQRRRQLRPGVALDADGRAAPARAIGRRARAHCPGASRGRRATSRRRDALSRDTIPHAAGIDSRAKQDA